MKLLDCKFEEFLEIIQGKKMVWFGASEMPREICEEYSEYCFEEKIEYFVDNSEVKQGKDYFLVGKSIKIVSPIYLLNNISEDVVIVITSKYYVDIWKQLQDMEELSNNWGVIWPMIAPQYKTDNELKKKIKAASDSKNRIPKKIHYFWFGGNPIPELESRCIESWKKFCSDYEIIRWDENNYDIHQNKYMEQAYKAQKWGFVPDYARLDVVYQHGGIYLDTDVEIIRNFDELLELPGFMGFESKKYINMGQGFGALARNSVIKLLRDDYETKEFIVENNQFNLTPSPVLQTEVLLKHGLKLNNKFQRIQDMMILPAECFSPDNNMIPHVTENTFSIHHFSGSWTPENNKRFLEKQRRFISRK